MDYANLTTEYETLQQFFKQGYSTVSLFLILDEQLQQFPQINS